MLRGTMAESHRKSFHLSFRKDVELSTEGLVSGETGCSAKPSVVLYDNW